MPVAVSRTPSPAAVPDVGRSPAGFKPTIVQPLGSGALGGALISIAATPNAAAVGDLVVVAFAWATSTTAISTVSDTSSNSWTIVQTPAPAQETGGYAYTTVATGWASGANTVTATLASGAPGGRIWAAAKITAAYSPVVDQHVESSATGDASVTTGTLAQAAESLVAVALDRAVANSTVAPTFPWSTNFIGVAQATGSGTLNSGVALAAYDNLSGVTGAVTAKAASTLNGDQIGIGVLAVKVTFAGGAVTNLLTVSLSEAVTAAILNTQTQKQLAITETAAPSVTKFVTHGAIGVSEAASAVIVKQARKVVPAAVSQTVAFDNATQSSTGLTFDHITSGLNRYLAVGIAIGGTTVSVTGITYAGAALTLLNRTVGPGTGAELWGLINPALGTNSVAITLSGAAGSQPGAVSFTNANQQVEPGATGGNSSTGSPALSAALTGSPGAMIVDALASNASTTGLTSGVQAWNDGAGDAQAYLSATGASQQISWSLSSSSGWADAAAVILPAGPVVNVAKQTNKPVAIAETAAVTIAKRLAKTVTTTETAAVSVAKFITHGVISVTETATVAVAKLVGKPVGVVETAAVSVTGRLVHLLTVALSQASSVTVAKIVAKPVALTETAAVAVSKRVAKLVAVSESAAVSVTGRLVHLLTVALSQASSVAIAKQTAKLVAVSEAATVSVAKRVAKTVTATETAALSVTVRLVHLLTIALSQASSVTVVKQTQKIVAAIQSSSVTVSKRIAKTVTAATTAAISVAFQITRGFVAAFTGMFGSKPTAGVGDSPTTGEYVDDPAGGIGSDPTSGRFD